MRGNTRISFSDIRKRGFAAYIKDAQCCHKSRKIIPCPSRLQSADYKTPCGGSIKGRIPPVAEKCLPVAQNHSHPTHPLTHSLTLHQSPQSPRSRDKHAICARFAASATRLKSFKNGAVSGMPPPSPLWPRYEPDAFWYCCGILDC